MRILTRNLFLALLFASTAAVGLGGCSGNEEKKDPIFETG